MAEAEALGEELGDVETKAPLPTLVGRLTEANAKTFGHRLRDEEVEKLIDTMFCMIADAEAKHLAKIWLTCRPRH